MIDNNLRQRFLQEVKGKEIIAEEVVQATKIKETSNNQMQKINNKEYENIDYINKKINKYENNETYNKPIQKFNKKNAADVIEYMNQGHVKHSTQNAISVTS